MKLDFSNKTLSFFKDISRSEIVVQAILVGLLAGFFVILFNLSINKVFSSIQNFIAPFSFGQKLFIFPFITTLGGLLSGYIVCRCAPETKGSGIPYVKLTLARLGSGIRIRSLFVKFFAGIIGIGSGLSLGKEGPSVQIGAGTGALISKLFKKRGTNQHNLVASGAAAALGATFNAPISGMVFALEELTQKFSPSTLFPVMIATVTAVSLTRYFVGENPSFTVPKNFVPFHFTLETILIYMLLGLIAGVLGVLFSKSIFSNLKLFSDFIKIPNWIKPGIAGFVVGIVGLFLPQILGSGTQTINGILAGKFTLIIVVSIFIGKFLLTSFCFGSGAAGGIFLPMLLLGASLGYLIGAVSNSFGLNIDLISISVVGMGAFLAAVARSPITAVMMVFEMTGDYNHILPVMLTVALADLTSEKLGHSPIYTSLILRQSKMTQESKILSDTKVKEVFDNNVPVILPQTKLSDALKLINTSKYSELPVKTQFGNLTGTISLSEIENYMVQGNNMEISIESIMNPDPLSVRLDDNLFKASFIMHANEADNVIVITNSGKVRGILSRSQLFVNGKN